MGAGIDDTQYQQATPKDSPPSGAGYPLALVRGNPLIPLRRNGGIVMGMFILGLFVGSLLGVFVMCMVQVGRSGGEEGERFEN